MVTHIRGVVEVRLRCLAYGLRPLNQLNGVRSVNENGSPTANRNGTSSKLHVGLEKVNESSNMERRIRW